MQKLNTQSIYITYRRTLRIDVHYVIRHVRTMQVHMSMHHMVTAAIEER